MHHPWKYSRSDWRGLKQPGLVNDVTADCSDPLDQVAQGLIQPGLEKSQGWDTSLLLV